MRKGKKIAVTLTALLSAGMLFSAVACNGNGSSESLPIDSSASNDSSNNSSDNSSDNSSGDSSSSVDYGEHLDKIPDSAVKTNASAGDKIATASWSASYEQDSIRFKAYVEDSLIYTDGGLYNNDGVELIIAKTQRLKGFSAGTISVTADATGEVKVKNLSTNAEVADSGVTVTAKKFTLTDVKTDGYYLDISVPYAATEATAADKNAAVCLGLTNANDGATIKSVYDSSFGVNWENVHTYAAIAPDNTFEENPYQQYGMVWGDGGSLKASSMWNVDGDDGSATANISMTGADANDNLIYMHDSDSKVLYAEVKINVKELLNGEKWGKFGVTLTGADGKSGFFFYVDASSKNGTSFDENSINLGFNQRTDKGWGGNWSIIGNLGGTSAQYTGSNYITLGIYRQGAICKLYANDALVKIVPANVEEDETAYIGLASFNITMNVKEYSLEKDESKLGDYTIEQVAKDYLFIGDSYIDTAFWYTYHNEFDTLSAANEGVGGTKVAYWQDMLLILKTMYAPENIIIHIGVNDIDGGTTGENTIEQLETLITSYKAAFPQTKIHYVSLVHNMMFKDAGKWAEYDKVNAYMKTAAAADENLGYIDMDKYITADANGSTMSWFNWDGLHYGVDGYAVFNREICKALGINRTATANGLGDVTVEGAPAYSYSAGWSFDAEGTAHNTGAAESQIFLSDLYAADFYAEAKISVAGRTAEDSFPKAGLALRTAGGTYFWALDCAVKENKDKYINGWSQVFFRPETLHRDWNWNGCFSDFQWTYNNQFPDEYPNGVSYDYKTDASFKTMAIAKKGNTVYFIADGKVVNCLVGIVGATEKAAVSVFNFNMEMYAKDGVVITEAAALKTKFDGLKIYENSGKTVDGSMSDWTEVQKTNAYVIPATDGRSVTIYATKDTDGIYVFYDAVHNSFRTDSKNWWENTNFELKFNDNFQRFASANGLVSRWEFAARQISAAKFVSVTENGKQHTTAEVFISYACIDGVDNTTAVVPMGFAWKTGGEVGSAWADGDYWYGAEADPGMRNILVTDNGIKTGSIRTIDGDAADWAQDTFASATVKAGVTATYSAFLGNDGLYLCLIVKEASIVVTATNTAGDWFKNTNLELFANANSNTHVARVITFGGKLYHTGFVTDAQMSFADGETEDTWTVELFIANEHLIGVAADAQSMKIDIGGQLYGAVTDTWQDYIRNTVVTRKA